MRGEKGKRKVPYKRMQTENGKKNNPVVKLEEA